MTALHASPACDAGAVDRGVLLRLRIEYTVALVGCIALAVWHIDEIRWPAFVALFAAIDVVGFLPGALAQRGRSEAVSAVYHALYNVTHSLAFGAAVALAWSLLLGFEWALLAIPLHLLGDRAVFGNLFKRPGTRFT